MITECLWRVLLVGFSAAIVVDILVSADTTMEGAIDLGIRVAFAWVTYRGLLKFIDAMRRPRPPAPR